jgi:O-methyltransferase involved in polyketide biosynthesis
MCGAPRAALSHTLVHHVPGHGHDLLASYVSRCNNPVVVALGEGLETQLWRIGDSRLRWFSVDVAEAIEVRRRLLPSHPQATSIACSALDWSWMDAVPEGAPPFVSAAGLLMYVAEADVRELLGRIAARFPGAEIFFDTITPHVSRRTQRGMKVTKACTAPLMPWGITLDDVTAFLDGIPRLEAISVRSYADPFPSRTRLYKALSSIGPLRRLLAGGLIHVRAAARRSTAA